MDGPFAGVGVGGGTDTIATVTQVHLNHFVVGMDPLAAIQHPRIYHQLVPNVVTYGNETVAGDEVIALSGEARRGSSRSGGGHRLRSTGSGAVCQFIVHDVAAGTGGGGGGGGVVRGRITVVGNPRKDGYPAGL
ncbi:hypothetical protein ACP4OV_022041 [Aristida adscensionis]